MSGTCQIEALILGTVNWGEADKIATLLTAERGQVKALVFGCRRPKSPLAAVVQPFNRAEFTLTEGQKLDTVRQAALQRSYHKIGENLTAMAYGSFVAELARELVPEGDPAAKMFSLTEKVFAALETRNPRAVAMAAAWQFLRLSGVAPDFGKNKDMSPSLVNLLQNMYTLDFESKNKIAFSAADFVAAEKILLANLRQTLDRPLKSLDFIRELR